MFYSHPNIIGYKEAFFEDTMQMLCIVMEYAAGGDLMSKIDKHKAKGTAFTEKEVWHIFIQVVRGLKALHDMHIYHRDIKAANIYLTADNMAKLGDMNVSKIAKAGMVYTQTGTPYYASPEVWKDLPYNGKSDIWSLGCVLYEMCAQRPPFLGDGMRDLYRKVIKGDYPRIPSIYSSELSAMIKQLLQTNPANRPTCDQILENAGLKTHMGETLKKLEPPKSSGGVLLSTIKVPLNFKMVNQMLPKPTYNNPPSYRVVHSSHMIDNTVKPVKSYERLPTPVVVPKSKHGMEEAKDINSKPTLAQRGAIQILKQPVYINPGTPQKNPSINFINKNSITPNNEADKKPPLQPSFMPAPIIQPPKIPSPPFARKIPPNAYFLLFY